MSTFITPAGVTASDAFAPFCVVTCHAGGAAGGAGLAALADGAGFAGVDARAAGLAGAGGVTDGFAATFASTVASAVCVLGLLEELQPAVPTIAKTMAMPAKIGAAGTDRASLVANRIVMS
jgi:hypothetical protein